MEEQEHIGRRRARPNRQREAHFYCPNEDKDGYDRAARRMGLSTSSWIRYVLRLAYRSSDAVAEREE